MAVKRVDSPVGTRPVLHSIAVQMSPTLRFAVRRMQPRYVYVESPGDVHKIGRPHRLLV